MNETTRSVVKVKLEVGEQAKATLDEQSKICNWLYNHLLETANDLKKQYIASDGQDRVASRIVYTKRGLRDLIPSLRKSHPFLNKVHGRPLQCAAIRLSRSIKAYQDYKKGKRPPFPKMGWPRFKSWNRKWFSLEYDYIPGAGGYILIGRDLTLSLGVDESKNRVRVTVKLSESIPDSAAKIRGVRVTKERGDYYAVFTVERALPEEKPPLRIIALDPNHKNLLYGVGSDGKAIEIQNFSPIKTFDKRIDDLKAKRDKCKRRADLVEFKRDDGTIHRHWQPSRRWQRYDEALDRLYQKRDRQKKLFLLTLANKLCKEYDVIAVGNYTPHGGGITTAMRRAMNNQSLIGQFKEVMAWTAKKSGKVYLEWEEKNTTRTCHICGLVVDGGIPPEIRSWVCEGCKTRHIRDENAAQNGLRKIQKNLLPDPGQPPRVLVRCTWRVLPSGVSVHYGGKTAFDSNCHDELNRERGSSRPPEG